MHGQAEAILQYATPTFFCAKFCAPSGGGAAMEAQSGGKSWEALTFFHPLRAQWGGVLTEDLRGREYFA